MDYGTSGESTMSLFSRQRAACNERMCSLLMFLHGRILVPLNTTIVRIDSRRCSEGSDRGDGGKGRENAPALTL
jgi:hypothetical protein